VNFAFIQRDGIPPGPPSPLLQNNSTFLPNATSLFMNPGDDLVVTEHDTEQGLKITVDDLTTGQSGFMVASAANGFAEILFDPNGSDCNPATHNLPYDFHPMYATSSEHTRVTWTAHGYNIAFSDEVGHFEYCATVKTEFGPCRSHAEDDPPGIDDNTCIDAAFTASYIVLGQLASLPIGGCFDADEEFDGVPYRSNTWPGSFSNALQDALFHPLPVIFSSLLFRGQGGDLQNYSRVAFETDLPRVEFATTPPCQRHLSNPADPNPGQGCVNPPVGADFYPFYSTRSVSGECRWQLGGPFIPGTVENFGGSSSAEYGPLEALFYPTSNGTQYIYENFHRTLLFNPCVASGEGSSAEE
jgi:hypothetical protein